MSDQVNASGHVTSNRTVKEIAFVRPIPILGTYKTEARFSAADGWLIEVGDYGVTLSKPEQQNVPEVPAFFTCGVGYSVPEDPQETQLREMLKAGIITEGDAIAIRAGYESHEAMVKALTADTPAVTEAVAATAAKAAAVLTDARPGPTKGRR